MTVLALGADGVPARVDLHTAMKWSTRGWELQLACPACGEPSRVLRKRGEVYCCARCSPRSSPHHRFKNCRSWRTGGKTTAAIVQELLSAAGNRPTAHLDELALSLVRGTMATVETLLASIYASLDATNGLVRTREMAPLSDASARAVTPRSDARAQRVHEPLRPSQALTRRNG